MTMAIEIRTATDADTEALARLAGRDSAAVPAGELLVAVDRGEIRAARSAHGEVIADPFTPTASLVAALDAFAGAAPAAGGADERAAMRLLSPRLAP